MGGLRIQDLLCSAISQAAIDGLLLWHSPCSQTYSEGEDVIYKHYAIVIAGKEFHVEGFVSGTWSCTTETKGGSGILNSFSDKK